MLGRRNRAQMELFVTGSLERLIPEDHILARVNRVLDLNCLREEVSDCYCADNGRPGIDPEVAVRLMLAGLLLGFVHDRRLMREAQVNLAIRWFIGYGLEDELPDHSSLTRIRQRWGEARFREIFRRTVRACLDAKVAKGEVVRGRLLDTCERELGESGGASRGRGDGGAPRGGGEGPKEDGGGGRGGGSGKVSRTDPDARLSRTGGGFEPSYKQHAVVDDARGVVLDVSVTEGTVNEREVLESQVEAVRELWGRDPALVTADAGYAYSKVYAALERRGVAALIPAKKEPTQSRVPLRLFRYDARHDIVKCPRGKTLSPRRPAKGGRYYRSRTRDCAGCALRLDCLPKAWSSKVVLVPHEYPALLPRDGAMRDGARRSGGCTGVICGARRAITVRRRPGTDWRARCGGALRT